MKYKRDNLKRNPCRTAVKSTSEALVIQTTITGQSRSQDILNTTDEDMVQVYNFFIKINLTFSNAEITNTIGFCHTKINANKEVNRRQNPLCVLVVKHNQSLSLSMFPH